MYICIYVYIYIYVLLSLLSTSRGLANLTYLPYLIYTLHYIFNKRTTKGQLYKNKLDGQLNGQPYVTITKKTTKGKLKENYSKAKGHLIGTAEEPCRNPINQ